LILAIAIPTTSTIMFPALLWCALAVAEEPDPLDPDRLEAEQVVIGEIILEKADVFDLSDPKENNRLYRLANRLHIVTKDFVIEQQLLFASGDKFSRRQVEETERILRRNTYFYDASITPVNRQDGTVDLQVNTRDVWTLKPGFSFSRSGGENRTLIKLEELNLFGWGQQVLVARSKDEDRESNTFTFRDRNLGRSWTQLRFQYSDNSDGHFNSLSVIRPFYKLDARWTAGMTGTDFDIERRLYQLGEEAAEFRHERELYSAFGGWSDGLQDGWVRRYTIGVAYDQNLFSVVPEPTLPPATPDDRELVYPYFSFELIEDQFETAKNRNQIQRTEDFLTGKRFAATLGWSDESFGADRDAAVYSVSASRSYGNLAKSAVLLAADASGRVEDGDAMNALLNISARYYNQQSDQRTFFTTLSATYGNNLDLDNPVELGGDTGLRGYPLRYQSGDSKMLLTVEQRYFWNWYPFRLVRVGGAIFADAGRTWGENPLGGKSLGWLSDVGFGLRLAPTRTGTRSIIHVDLAFPLNGDDSIDSVQFLIESKKSF
jgi:outer membrane protein assembly factor BamA